MSSLPLAGVRVADFTRMFAGPCATETLADLGAEVIKVEEPRIGDPTRRNLPMWGPESAYFISLNRGKRSVTLDLKSERGRSIALDLIGSADIVAENFRPGVMDRLGLGWEDVKALHPGIVYCSLSGFGATGPLRDKISFDLVNQAMAGLIDVTGHAEKRPVRVGVPIGDMAGGLYLAIAANAGLRHRRVTGQGCWVDLALHDVLISLLGDVGQRYFLTGQSPRRTGSRHRDVAPHGCYEVADGWIVLSALTPEHWEALLGVISLPELAGDPRFATAQSRRDHLHELDPALGSRLIERSTDEWLRALTAAGVPVAPVLPLDDALKSPLVRGRGIVFSSDHPTVGRIRNLASPLVVDGERLGANAVSPVLGDDTEAVLAELGVDEGELENLAAENVIRRSPRRHVGHQTPKA